MNTVIISGRVQKDIKRDQGKVSFDISVYDGKDREGNARYFYITVKAFADRAVTEVPGLVAGADCMVYGRIHKFKYNEKYYTEISAAMSDCRCASRPQSQPYQRQDGGSNDSIPF